MIFAIDPGPELSSFVRWDGKQIGERGTVPNMELYGMLHHNCSEGYFLDEVYIEMIASYGMPVGREVFETCFWIGRFFEVSLATREGPERVVRSAVKLHHCQSVRAKDSNIIQALKDKYGAKGTKKNPGVTYGLKGGEWQAFALATYVTETRK